jgi:hypothetical protein
MALDLERLKFGGKVVTVAEDELSASVTDDTNDEFTTSLWNEYVKQGKPQNVRAWIRTELRKHFLFVTKPPVWIERMTIPKWPFYAGKPMIFIGQFSVPETEVSKAKVSAGTMLYVFGSRKPLGDGGWEMVYTVVEQEPSL